MDPRGPKGGKRVRLGVAVAASTVRRPSRGGWTPKSRSVEASGTGSRSGRAVTVKSMGEVGHFPFDRRVFLARRLGRPGAS
jgi:hypothetical protein